MNKRSPPINLDKYLEGREHKYITYEIVSGHRRHRAAKKAGVRKIPAIIKEMAEMK